MTDQGEDEMGTPPSPKLSDPDPEPVRPRLSDMMPRNQMGRPSKFTEGTRKTIIAAMTAGNFIHVACAAAGIGRHTYYDWINRGREAAALVDQGVELDEREQEYLDFALAIAQAEAQAEVRAVTLWSAAMADDWRAAKDFLARRQPGRWKEITGTELTGSDGLPMSSDSGTDDEAINALARQLAIRSAAAEDPVDAELVDEEE